MPEIDRDLLATYLRNKIKDENLSLRRAADRVGCSPATLSRLMNGSKNGYLPDTATLAAVTGWLSKGFSDFEEKQRPKTSTLAEVEVHLHALPDITDADAKAMMAAVRAWYEQKRKESDASP